MTLQVVFLIAIGTSLLRTKKIRPKGPKLFSAKGMASLYILFRQLRNLIIYELAGFSKLINRNNFDIDSNYRYK
jgi:hypothetical protein